MFSYIPPPGGSRSVATRGGVPPPPDVWAHWDNGHLARCGSAGIAIVYAPPPLSPSAAINCGPPAWGAAILAARPNARRARRIGRVAACCDRKENGVGAGKRNRMIRDCFDLPGRTRASQPTSLHPRTDGRTLRQALRRHKLQNCQPTATTRSHLENLFANGYRSTIVFTLDLVRPTP